LVTLDGKTVMLLNIDRLFGLRLSATSHAPDLNG
jgi:hypothetical protein